jgi:hypothetical protein
VNNLGYFLINILAQAVVSGENNLPHAAIALQALSNRIAAVIRQIIASQINLL